MINPDAPIKLREEDLLDRWDFAEHIAKVLLNQKNKECIVIGIYGKWGSGKSSLVNLVENSIEKITQKSFNKYMNKAIDEWYKDNGFVTPIIPYINMPLDYEKLPLKSILYMDIRYKKNSLINLTQNSLKEIHDNKKAPIIFRFNPWNISTMDKLISTFFQELSIAIEKEDSSKNARDLAKRLELYSTFFKPFTYYPDSIINSASKEVKNILKDASNSIKDEYKQTVHNLEDTKKDIEDHLKNLNRKVIIIIDDIDRLTQTEICQIFQLVKINANFKNVIYLLLFDRDIVEKALNEISNGEGREYLEKIIQMPFIVPKIDDEILDELLKKELTKVLQSYLEDNFDKHRFSNVYYSGYRDFFKSVRDIKRYKNSLKSNISLVYEDVNIIDFLIIEAFRIFIPEIYTLIAENKEFFTNNTNSLSDTEKQAWEQRSGDISKKIGQDNEVIYKSLLAYLFPRKYELFGEKYPTDTLNEIECQRERRICSKIFFDIYFISGVPKYTLSESKFNKVIKKLKRTETKICTSKGKNFTDPESLRSYYSQKQLEQDDYSLDIILNKLIDKKYATQFLRKLRVRNIEFSKEFLKEFLIVLFNVCDDKNRDTETIDVYEMYMVIEKYFQLMEFSDKKTLFEDVVKSSNGIVSLAEILYINMSFNEPNSTFKPIFSQDDSEYFEELWVDKMESFVIYGELKDHKKTPYLLSMYKIWGNEEKAKKYFDELISSQNEFLYYLKNLCYKKQVRTLLDKVSRSIDDINYSFLEEFLSIYEIEARINDLDNLTYSDSLFVEFAKECLVKYKRRSFTK